MISEGNNEIVIVIFLNIMQGKTCKFVESLGIYEDFVLHFILTINQIFMKCRFKKFIKDLNIFLEHLIYEQIRGKPTRNFFSKKQRRVCCQLGN